MLLLQNLTTSGSSRHRHLDIYPKCHYVPHHPLPIFWSRREVGCFSCDVWPFIIALCVTFHYSDTIRVQIFVQSDWLSRCNSFRTQDRPASRTMLFFSKNLDFSGMASFCRLVHIPTLSKSMKRFEVLLYDDLIIKGWLAFSSLSLMLKNLDFYEFL